MNNPQLCPCRKCGDNMPYFVPRKRDGNKPGHAVLCGMCGNVSPVMASTEKAAEAWNKANGSQKTAYYRVYAYIHTEDYIGEKAERYDKMDFETEDPLKALAYMESHSETPRGELLTYQCEIEKI